MRTPLALVAVLLLRRRTGNQVGSDGHVLYLGRRSSVIATHVFITGTPAFAPGVGWQGVAQTRARRLWSAVRFASRAGLQPEWGR